VYTTDQTTPRLWTVDEVATMFRCTPQTVRRLINVGHLRARRLSDRPRSEWRITDADLRAYLARRA
jgi:excisionase family DNA binding protein